MSGRGPDGAGPGPSLQGAAQAEAGFVESALGFPDRAPGSERAFVADIEWRSQGADTVTRPPSLGGWAVPVSQN